MGEMKSSTGWLTAEQTAAERTKTGRNVSREHCA
jgi:hypothetical protein